eukprot:COSAG01_NODE_1173_length_11400_cov_2.767366_14_plen_130_part_00
MIKVSDEGGGIPRSLMNKVFSYSFSTADSEQALQVVQHDFGTSSPLAGLGYGLPVARSYARYFGGDLVVIPVEGYGTDAFVYHLRVRSLMLRSYSELAEIYLRFDISMLIFMTRSSYLSRITDNKEPLP